MGPLVVVVVVVVVIAGVAWFSYARKKKRAQALAVFASQHGLDRVGDDALDVSSYPFRLFTEGDGRGCENVMAGSWQGMPVKEADYWYYTQSTDSQGRTSRTYHHFSVVLADLPCTVPGVSIEKEGVFQRLAGHLGFHDIEFESEDFNQRFRVRGDDREFAFQIVDDRMMSWLMSTDDSFGFEVNGSSLLTWCRRLDPAELFVLFGSARAFVEHVPRLVWNEYGTKGQADSLPQPDQRGSGH